MATPYKSIVPFKNRLHNFCVQRIYELEHKLTAIHNELDFYKELQKTAEVCGSCNGEGTIKDMISDSEYGPSYMCPLCKGSGVKK